MSAPYTTSYEIRFGQVPVGTTAVKLFPIRNKHHEAVTYFVTRSKFTNPIYYVYDVNSYEATVESGEDFNLKISYSPNISGSKNCDYFGVVDTKQNYYSLCFVGECIGPAISCSIRHLVFSKTATHKLTKQTFALTNTSSVVPATYQFDCCEDEQGAFEVKPFKGLIQPKEEVYVTVKFSPKNANLYAKQLCCLILHQINLQEPILVNLFGISTDADYNLEEIVVRQYPFPYEETVGFGGFTSDCVTVKAVPPPISLSVNHLDFGRVVPENPCQILVTSLTNHMDTAVEVTWENVTHFRIFPEKLQVPPKQSALYECRFHPEAACKLHAAILNGHVSWTFGDNEIEDFLNVPIPVTLRVIGHSFPKNQSWIPSVSIVPNTIVLPMTMPTYPSWATFLIESRGHLPVLFKLLPPKKTNFVMKPMMGLIRGHQIVVVQLEKVSGEKTSHVEQWNIELNGQVERLLPIYVKAQTELPCIVIGHNNYIQFEAVQPGTTSLQLVPVRNISSCHLQFEFKETNNLQMNPVAGRLAPNEEMFVKCSYNSAPENFEGHNVFGILCQVQCIYSQQLVIGEPLDIVVTVEANCCYSELCGLPHSYECGDVEWGTNINTSFYLYNFGDSSINFTLCHNHHLNDVILQPDSGKCGPKEKLRVLVGLTIKNIGGQDLIISYRSQTVVGGQKDVFKIEYNCMFPTFQITDLVEHNYGYLFCKDALWKHLKIAEINLALAETVHGEIKRIDVPIPDCEVCDELFYVVLVVQNISSISSDLTLKRRQVCDCEHVESNTNFTFRQKICNCPHKQLLCLEISSPEIPAKATELLTIKIRYVLPNHNMLSYIIEMSSSRTVILNFHILSIPQDSPILGTFDSTFDLAPVFIGLREPPVQAFWLYNNTSRTTSYELDDLEIVKLCNRDDFPVLRCLNCTGCLKPKSVAPILFAFWPIEVKVYSVAVPIILGTKKIILRIQGQGSERPNKISFESLQRIPTKCLKHNAISFSIDQLNVEPILVANSTERLFFIKNRSKDREIKYSWRPCLLEGLLQIEPQCWEGLLKPKETQSAVVKITSLGEPCSVVVPVQCEYVSNNCADIISLPIAVNIIGISDRDSCIHIEDQMKQKPFEHLQIDVNDCLKEYFDKTETKERPIRLPRENVTTHEPQVVIDEEMTRNVLECLISDAVFSEYVYETIKRIKNEPSPLYSQIKLDDINVQEQRRREVKRALTQLEMPAVADLCQDLVFKGVHSALRLGPVMKNQTPKK